jgi:hypothetical protein
MVARSCQNFTIANFGCIFRRIGPLPGIQSYRDFLAPRCEMATNNRLKFSAVVQKVTINANPTFLRNTMLGLSSDSPVIQDLLEALQDEDLTDVTLEGQDGIPIPASRFVLAARSAVLKRMLYGNFREANTSRISLEDYEISFVHPSDCCIGKATSTIVQSSRLLGFDGIGQSSSSNGTQFDDQVSAIGLCSLR